MRGRGIGSNSGSFRGPDARAPERLPVQGTGSVSVPASTPRGSSRGSFRAVASSGRDNFTSSSSSIVISGKSNIGFSGMGFTNIPSDIGVMTPVRDVIPPEERKALYMKRQHDLSKERMRLNNLPTVYPEKVILRALRQQTLESTQRIHTFYGMSNSNGSVTSTVIDTALGNPNIREPCGNELCKKIACPGHLGSIYLPPEYYIYVPFYVPSIVNLLNCFCRDCGRLYSDPLPSSVSSLPPEKRLAEAAKKLITVDNCRTPREANNLPCGQRYYYWSEFQQQNGNTNIIESGKKKGSKDNSDKKPIAVATVYERLRGMQLEGLKKLGFTADGDKLISHPENFIVRRIPVIPYPARSPMVQKGKVTACFLTSKYNELATTGSTLKSEVDRTGKPIFNYEGFYSLQRGYNAIINGETKTSKGQKNGKSQGIIGLTQGKKSVIRGSMMGKINEGTARGVASSAPIRHGTIGVPVFIARVFSQPIKVTSYNKEYLQTLFAKKLVDYYRPGSTGVFHDCASGKEFTLYIGDTIGKFIEEGDWTIDNRHPTLSKPSMQAHRIVFGKTFEERRSTVVTHHGSDTTPSNMDFDGDDKNLVCPISVYARAEAAYLLHVPNIIMSDSQNRPIVGLIINSILASYLLTQRDVILDETLFRRLLNIISCREGFDTYFQRLQFYGVHPRSGAAIYSALLPSDLFVDTYEIRDGRVKGVTICNGIIVRGVLDKGLVGPAHRSLIQEIYKLHGAKRTSIFLTDAVFVCNKWISEYGFSCGIRDFLPDDPVEMEKMIDAEIASVSVLIESLGGKKDDPQQEAFRTKRKNEYFDSTKSLGVKLTKKLVLEAPNNRLGIMHKDRSQVKGDTYNLNQLVGVGGIKKYDGEFLTLGSRDGTLSLPQFVAGSLDMRMYGFVTGNYQKGYEPHEVFFDAKAGRASIINTNVDTAITGYMQRKVGKITEGITVGPKGDVINMNGVNFGPVANCGYAISMLLEVTHPYKGKMSFFFDPLQTAQTVNSSYHFYKEDLVNTVKEGRQENKDEVGYTNIPLTAPKKKYGRKFTGGVHINRHTRFERTAIIARRADEIENNCSIRLQKGQRMGRVFSQPEEREIIYDPVRIAAKEYRLGLLGDMFVLRNNGDISIPATPEYLNIH